MRLLLLGMALTLALVAKVASAGEEQTECPSRPITQPNPDYAWPQEQESTMGRRQ